MPAIYHEGSWLGNATDPEVLVKDTVGWTGKNGAYSQTNNAVVAHIENGITYDVSWTGSATVTLKKNSASGATITSGSTSPLSFTADADYELYFGSSATVTNIMVKDSRITDPTYEPYHESVEVMYEEEIHGVNLATAYPNYVLIGDSTQGFHIEPNRTGGLIYIAPIKQNTSYIASKAPVGNRFRIVLFKNEPSSVTTTDAYQVISEGDTDRTSYEFANMDYNYAVFATAGTGGGGNVNTTNGMIRLATIEDSTYRPYNPQAIQNQLNAQGVLGAKNLMPISVTSRTFNGVTFTVNTDGSITANGTATANTSFRLIPYADIVDKYLDLWTGKPLRLSGCPSGGSDSTYALEMFYNDGQKHWLRDFGDGVEVNIPTSGITDVNPNIMVKNRVTVNNLVFKPMLRLASDPDDTYQPYAMTNRELTEAVAKDRGTIVAGYEYERFGGFCLINVNAQATVSAGTWTIIASRLPFRTNNIARAWFRTVDGNKAVQAVVEDVQSSYTQFQIRCEEALSNATIRGQIIYGIRE